MNPTGRIRRQSSKTDTIMLDDLDEDSHISHWSFSSLATVHASLRPSHVEQILGIPSSDRFSPAVISQDSSEMSQPSELYEDLDYKINSFRIFCLHGGSGASGISGHLIPSKLSPPPVYEALSYSWGTPLYVRSRHRAPQRARHHDIVINKRPFAVSASLYQALLGLRHPKRSRMLWIDAICINQIDTSEKNDQVSLMPKIYNRAEYVIVWLGNKNHGSSFLMTLMNEIYVEYDQIGRRRRILHALRAPGNMFLEAYAYFFQRSYWYRTWVIQEIYFAKQSKLVVQCGRSMVTWAALVDFQQFISAECYGTKEVRGMDRFHIWVRSGATTHEEMEGYIKHSHRFSTIASLRASQGSSPAHQARRTLDSLLFENWDCMATLPVDKVYAILRLASDGRRYDVQIDYGVDVNILYTKIVRDYIRTYRNLSIILPRRTRNPANYIPSWCPDWSSSTPLTKDGNAWDDVFPFQVHSTRSYNAPGDKTEPRVSFSPCLQFMTAYGWRLDIIYSTPSTTRRPFRSPKKKLFDFSEILDIFRSIFRSSNSRRPATTSNYTEIDTWYATHRRSLRRSFRLARRRRIIPRGSTFIGYCEKKHDEFLAILLRALNVYAEQWNGDIKNSPLYHEWRANADIPTDDMEYPPCEVMSSSLLRTMQKLGPDKLSLNQKYRGFFVTSNGFLGLGPSDSSREGNGSRERIRDEEMHTMPQDMVCILRGCSLPVLLRLDGGGACWRLVGPCYVAGFMHGQFVDHRQKLRIQEEPFILC